MKKIIFLIFVLFLSVGSVSASQTVQVNNGRYIIYQNSQFRGDQFLLDTQTGKVWNLVKDKDGVTVWEQMLFDCYNNDKTYSGRYVNPR